jgi:outer membrane protein W
VIRAAVTIAILVAAAPVHAERARPGAVSYQRLYFRAGVLHIAPLSQSRELELSGVGGPASLAVTDGPIAGSGVSLDALTIPALIAGYVLPIGNQRLSIETVLSLPLHVTFRATGTLADMSLAPEALGIPTGVPPLGSQLGEADAAPPVVTAVYRIADLGPVTPYVGTGLGVLITYNARATNPVLTEVAAPTFRIDPAPGWVLQTGVDVALWRRLSLRVDIKYIAFMRAHATVENLQVRTPQLPLFETARVGSASMDLWVNPLIVQVGLGIDL